MHGQSHRTTKCLPFVKNFRFSFWLIQKHTRTHWRNRKTTNSYSYYSGDDGNSSSSISSNVFLSGLTSQCLPTMGQAKQSKCCFHFSCLCYVRCSSSSVPGPIPFVRVKQSEKLPSTNAYCMNNKTYKHNEMICSHTHMCPGRSESAHTHRYGNGKEDKKNIRFLYIYVRAFVHTLQCIGITRPFRRSIGRAKCWCFDAHVLMWKYFIILYSRYL